MKKEYYVQPYEYNAFADAVISRHPDYEAWNANNYIQTFVTKRNNDQKDIIKKANNLQDYADSVNTYTKQLEAKKKEAENLLNKAVDDAKNKATDTAKKAADDATKKATDAAKEKLKGFLR